MNKKIILTTASAFVIGISLFQKTVIATTEDTYTIETGDTLYRIALNHGVDMHALASNNNLSLEQTIYPGQVLFLPSENPIPEPVRTTAYYGSTLTQAQYEVLCAVVQQEAGAENPAGLAAVMSVITNRVDSNWMGATDVYGVITQAYQFEAYGAGHYQKHLGNISQNTLDAVNNGLSGLKTVSATSFRSTAYAIQNGYSGLEIDGNTFFVE